MGALFLIRPADPDDHPEWLRLRNALFPGHAESEGSRYQHSHLLVAEMSDGKLGGFIEIGMRNYAENCDSSPVPYIEAWYVEPELQRQGIGRALVEGAEEWARNHGFGEIASDTDLDNQASIEAHQALGYREVARLVCFRKALADSEAPKAGP